MKNWLVALVLGATALGAVFVLWKREDMPQPGLLTAPRPGPTGEPAPATPSVGPASPGSAPSQPAEVVINVSDAWASPTSPGKNTASAYMLLTNVGRASDRIVSVESPDAREAFIRETVVKAKGVVTVLPIAHVDLDPGLPLVLEPGGLQVALKGLNRTLHPGDKITVIFRLEHAPPLSVEVPVREDQIDGDSLLP